MFIGGEWKFEPESELVVRNPSDESILATVPRAGSDDLARALSAAQQGFRVWRDTPVEARNQVIRKAVELVRARADLIASTLTLEHGKPLADAKSEVNRAIGFFEWDMAEALRMYGT